MDYFFLHTRPSFLAGSMQWLSVVVSDADGKMQMVSDGRILIGFKRYFDGCHVFVVVGCCRRLGVQVLASIATSWNFLVLFFNLWNYLSPETGMNILSWSCLPFR